MVKSIMITRKMQEFKHGEKVCIVIDKSIQAPNKRFDGRTGVIVGRRGKAYIILIKDKGKEKKIISFPDHLKRCE